MQLFVTAETKRKPSTVSVKNLTSIIPRADFAALL